MGPLQLPLPNQFLNLTGTENLFRIQVDWKLKAVALDLNLDDILLRPTEWQATVRALQQRVDGRAGPSTRSSSSTAVDPATQADQSQLQAELAKSKLLARILIGKLKPSVSQILRDTLPEEEQFNPISIYRFLRQQYAVSDEARKTAENPETLFLEILSFKLNQNSVLSYVKNIQQKLSVVFLSPKFAADDNIQRAFSSLVVKHVLEQVRSRQISFFEPLLEKFMPLVLSSRDLLPRDTLSRLSAEIERISLLHPFERRDKPKGGASSAPSEKSKHPEGGGHSSGSHRSQKPPSKNPSAKGGASVSSVVEGSDSVNVSIYAVSVSKAVTGKEKFLLVDSGATHHCVREKSLFTQFRPGKHVVRVANNQTVTAKGKGDVELTTLSTDGKPVTMKLTNAYFVPQFTTHIFSTNYFLAANSENSILLSADKRVLHTSVCDIDLHAEHNLVWLPATLPKRHQTARPELSPVPAATVSSSPVAPAVPAAVPLADAVPAAPAPAAAPAGEAAVSVVLPAVQTTMTMRLFHERFGHLNVKVLACIQQSSIRARGGR